MIVVIKQNNSILSFVKQTDEIYYEIITNIYVIAFRHM